MVVKIIGKQQRDNNLKPRKVVPASIDLYNVILRRLINKKCK